MMPEKTRHKAGAPSAPTVEGWMSSNQVKSNHDNVLKIYTIIIQSWLIAAAGQYRF
jgi:hypothetical protein